VRVVGTYTGKLSPDRIGDPRRVRKLRQGRESDPRVSAEPSGPVTRVRVSYNVLNPSVDWCPSDGAELADMSWAVRSALFDFPRWADVGPRSDCSRNSMPLSGAVLECS
jgi:hypothetical protein